MFFIYGLSILLLLSAFSLSHANQKQRGIYVMLKQKTATGAPVYKKVKLYGASHALVIGINAYNNGWPRLSGAVQDAEIISRELEKKGFKVTFRKDLTAGELATTLDKFFVFEGDDPSARLFVWFAGHGHTQDDEGYLIPSDCPLPSKGAEFRYKALSMRRFGEFVRKAKSKHAFVVFDSCFSGTIFNTQRSLPPAAITRATTLPVRQFLSSGDANQQVSDNGQFRKLFIRAINGEERADANDDGYLTGSELGMFLCDRVTNLTQSRQTPRYGKLRDPNYDQGDFVFKISHMAPSQKKSDTGDTASSFLTVESNVQAAEVFIDNRMYGKTDLKDARMQSGKHRLKVVKNGYSPYLKEIEVMEGRSFYVYVDLNQIHSGRLHINPWPKDAQITLPNNPNEFYQGIELNDGRYLVEISARGYQTKELWVNISAGMDKTYDVQLEPDTDRQPNTDVQFELIGKNIIRDKTTRLEWHTGADHDISWSDAHLWAVNLEQNSGGWRLPSINELKSIYKVGLGNRNMSPLFNIQLGWWCWSNQLKGTTSAYGFNFDNGNTDWFNKNYTSNFRVIAVRERDKTGKIITPQPIKEEKDNFKVFFGLD